MITKLVVGGTALASMCLFTGCKSIDPNLVSSAVRPVLEQVEGLSPQQTTAVTKAVTDAVVGNLSPGVDWSHLVTTVIGMAGAYFGVNIRRDYLRARRNEPVGSRSPVVELASDRLQG